VIQFKRKHPELAKCPPGKTETKQKRKFVV